jgi:intermembrane space import and assembly protein 40
MSFQELAAEALSGADGEEDAAKRVDDALACPCIADLKEGPCGPKFVDAFKCFIVSEHEDKGMDCLEEFRHFQVRDVEAPSTAVGSSPTL